MTIEKRNFKFKDTVTVQRTDTSLDGTKMTILGVASRGYVDIYIVEFEDKIPRKSIESFNQEPIEYTALALPEYCLDLIK